MDPLTVFIVTIVMTLLNGGVLGFMHHDIAQGLKVSSTRWRVGTLLLASGLAMLAAQRIGPAWLVLPIGNTLLVTGIVEYWRALEHFDGRERSRLAWLVPLGLGALIWVFVELVPGFALRSVVASFVWAGVGAMTVRTLVAGRSGDPSAGRRVLLAVYVILTTTMFVRALYFAVGPGREQTVLDPNSAVNALTPLIASVLPVIGTTSFLVMCSDRLRRQLEHAASTDALTELANRRTLSVLGNEAIARARTAGTGLAATVIDVDHFKSINDRHGHDVGDVALRHVASRLRAACRSDDLPARQGGEEFVVVLQRVDRAQAVAAAERLRRALAETPYQSGQISLSLTASFGVAVLEPSDQSFDDLLRRADQALYRAKANGRNRVEQA